MRKIQSWDEVPSFASEAEEAEFWATHSLGEGVLSTLGPLQDGVLPSSGSGPGVESPGASQPSSGTGGR